MSEVEYNALIFEISEKIEETNLDFLKFMCRHHLGNGTWEHITTVRKLLLELEKKNRLGIDRLDLLKEIVTQLKKQKRTLLKKVDDFEVRRKAQSIGVISRLNRAADSLVGVVRLVCTWKTAGGVLLGSCGLLALSKCSTLPEVFEAFEKVVLPTGVKLMGISDGSLCFTVQAEMASALNELWNLYNDGTLQNCLQEFLVTKEVKDLAGSDEVEVTVFIDEHEWKEAYINMLFHQNQADTVKEEQVGERRRRNSDSFLFLKSKESNMTKMKLEQSENKWNFERQLFQQEVKQLQMLIKQTEEGGEVDGKTKYTLLCCLLVRLGSQVLRDVFDRTIRPQDLCSALKNEPAHSKLQSLRKEGILNPVQWSQLYPIQPSSVSSTGFDPSLLIVLLRTICNLSPPSSGWDLLPHSLDTSCESDIVRLKYFVDAVSASAKEASVSDAVFCNYKDEIQTTLVRLGGAEYEDAIHELEKLDMGPLDGEYFKEVLKRWKDENKRIKDKLNEWECTMKTSRDADEVAPELPSQLEQELNLKNSKRTGKEVVTEPLYQAKPSSKISPPRISSKVDPLRTDPRDERAGESVRKSWNSKTTGKEVVTKPLYRAKPKIRLKFKPVLTKPFSRRREKEKATTFSEIRSPSSSSKVDPIPVDESWYFGNIDQWSAERILQDQNPGRFLVREDLWGLDSYIISWRDTDGYRHQEIERFSDRMFLLRGKENLRFSSLEASVLHFITCSTNDMAMVPLSKEKGKIPSYERFLATSTYTPHPRLHLSVETGDTHEIETLLSSGVDIDSRDMHGRTPLMLAAESGGEKIFRLLIERGSDPTLKDSRGRSVLHWAARSGSNEIIQELLSRGLDIDSRDNTGDTPLTEAIYCGRENAVRLLIERGSDPTLKGSRGRSMLHWAAENGRNGIIQELLSRGLDINSRDRDGDTPVIMAAINGQEDAITLLLERGSDPKQKDAKGRGLLHWAAYFGRDVLIENLLSLGLDINSRENYGDTPLMKAAYCGRENAFSLLVERGSDLTLTDNRGQSALHWAARGGSKVIIEKLLSLGLDINSKTNSDETPLMLATKLGKAEAVNYLVSRGAK